ncbi:MAG: YgiT-type zinc finger protein [Candidatus Coatesbacteria bacterium]|nr:YgiT-type zinc finger protein [Candidatus Coatesbacteria bacterium]
MFCSTCGLELFYGTADLPFNIGPSSVVTINQVPILYCEKCRGVVLEDSTMETIDKLLASVKPSRKIKPIKFPT